MAVVLPGECNSMVTGESGRFRFVRCKVQPRGVTISSVPGFPRGTALVTGLSAAQAREKALSATKTNNNCLMMKRFRKGGVTASVKIRGTGSLPVSHFNAEPKIMETGGTPVLR